MRKDIVMDKTLSWKKILGLIALILAPFLLAQCGDAGMSATSTVGEAGPTEPSGYYFNATVSPHSIISGAIVTIHVRVWDSNGNLASGVWIALSGVVADPKDVQTQTGSDGTGGWVFEMKYPPGSVIPVNITVENKTLSVPVQIITGASSE